ncbi:DUF3304 domain-containing protein [Pseudomonas viridiflava]|uniref:DUF3304 domain-containing protein n=1 Tax=Pseudomonas viridiflava TaxID=33069 RepID=UPI002406585A|nr:DUF3304 domain-containing protein [Pseudomonas viridiflava]
MTLTRSGRYSVARLGVCVGVLLAQGAQASTLEAINHTHWAINRFSVDGRSGIDIIGPYQGGGGGCCYVAPSRWEPGMTVRVDWEAPPRLRRSAVAHQTPGVVGADLSANAVFQPPHMRRMYRPFRGQVRSHKTQFLQ